LTVLEGSAVVRSHHGSKVIDTIDDAMGRETYEKIEEIAGGQTKMQSILGYLF